MSPQTRPSLRRRRRRLPLWTSNRRQQLRLQPSLPTGRALCHSRRRSAPLLVASRLVCALARGGAYRSVVERAAALATAAGVVVAAAAADGALVAGAVGHHRPHSHRIHRPPCRNDELCTKVRTAVTWPQARLSHRAPHNAGTRSRRNRMEGGTTRRSVGRTSSRGTCRIGNWTPHSTPSTSSDTPRRWCRHGPSVCMQDRRRHRCKKDSLCTCTASNARRRCTMAGNLRARCRPCQGLASRVRLVGTAGTNRSRQSAQALWI